MVYCCKSKLCQVQPIRPFNTYAPLNLCKMSSGDFLILGKEQKITTQSHIRKMNLKSCIYYPWKHNLHPVVFNIKAKLIWKMWKYCVLRMGLSITQLYITMWKPNIVMRNPMFVNTVQPDMQHQCLYQVIGKSIF